MKKATVLFSCLILLLSCAKSKTESSSKNNSSPNLNSLSGELTVGQLHNILVEDYLETYASEEFADNMNYSATSAIVTRLSNISQGYGFNGQITPQSISDYVMSGLVNSSCFDGNQMLKPFNDCYGDLLNNINNSSIRQALNDIKYLAENRDENFLQSAHRVVQNLTNLSTDELTLIDGYISVLDNSNELWSSKSELVDDVTVDAIDAAGYAIGFAIARINDKKSLTDSKIFAVAYGAALSTMYYAKSK